MDPSDGTPLDARAWYVGRRLDLRALERAQPPLATGPLVLAAEGEGRVVPFRFGVVVCFGLDEAGDRRVLDGLRAFVEEPVVPVLAEDVDVVVVPAGPERVSADGQVQLAARDPGRLAVVADVLAKSALLSHHEQAVAGAFDHVEGLALDLSDGRFDGGSREVQAQIGKALAVQIRTLGRAAVADKPDLIWDQPELDRLYVRLADEFELGDRDRALHRKLDLVGGAAQTYVELLHSRHALRLEWAIVLLIVFEIVIILWDMAGGGGH